MSLRDIVKDGDPILRRISRKVDRFDDKLGKLLDDMRETMKHAEGVGLAGPQVGIARRLAVVEVGETYIELVNPVIVERSGSQVGQEACLSVPNKACMVERPMNIVVQYSDRFGKQHTGEYSGFIARACCHEIDHLDGHLFYDFEYKGGYRQADKK